MPLTSASMRYTNRAWALLILICSLPLTPLGAEPVPAGVDPKADAALRKMGRTLQNAQSFSFELNDSVDQILDNGQKVQLEKIEKVLVRRPNAMSASVVGDLEEMQYVYRGTTMMLVNRKENCYALQDVPDTIDAMFDFLAEKYGIVAPLSDLMFADPYKTLVERVRFGTHMGMHSVRGVKCHHLAFRQEAIDWQIWIEDGEQALPRKVVITFKEQPGHPQFTAYIDKGNLSADAPDSAFDTTPPTDAKRIDLTPTAQPGKATDKP